MPSKYPTAVMWLLNGITVGLVTLNASYEVTWALLFLLLFRWGWGVLMFGAFFYLRGGIVLFRGRVSQHRL